MSWFPIPRDMPHAVIASSDKLKSLQAEAAATPELLKALKDIAAYYPNSWAADIANAVIARATGGAA